MLYIFKKIYDSSEILASFDHNKNYGLDKDEIQKGYYYAMPYTDVDKPATGSEFNDIYTVLVLTVSSYLEKSFSFRKGDILRIFRYIMNTDSKSQHSNSNFIMLQQITNDYNDFNNSTTYGNIKMFNEKIIAIKEYCIMFYLTNCILPEIEYPESYTNTSFIELLHPSISKNYIGFTGTIEYIGKIQGKYPKINNREIFTLNNEFSTKEKEYKLSEEYFKNFKKVFFDSENYGEIFEHIKKNININCLIDIAAIFKLKSATDYAKIIFDELNKDIKRFDYILFFGSGSSMFKYLGNDEYEIFDRETLKEQENLDAMEKKKYFVFFDNVHVRGTDIRLPLKTHGLCTISYICDFVNVMQGIYRLRSLSKGQTCEFIAQNNLPELKENLMEYLKNNTLKYIKNQFSELLVQSIYSNIKFVRSEKNNYIYIKNNCNNKIIPTFDELDKMDDIKKKNYNLKNRIDGYCYNDCGTEIYVCMCCNILQLSINFNINKYELSASHGLNKSIEVRQQKNINININIYIPGPNILYINGHIYNLKNPIYTNNKFTEIYSVEKAKHNYLSLYSYYKLGSIDKRLFYNNIYFFLA